MNTKKVLLSSIFAACFMMLSLGGKAQFDNTLYHLSPVFQTSLSNPAFIPDVQYHFGVPALSSLYTEIGTSGIRYNQLFTRRADDSLEINFKDLSKHIKNSNSVTARQAIQWLSGGMKWKDYYFTLSISDYFDLNMLYSDDMVNFLAYGNGPMVGQTINFDPSFMKMTHYRQYSMGAAWDFDSRWNFGARLNIVMGKSNIYTKKLKASLYTADNTYYLTPETNLEINTSLPDSWRNGEGIKLTSDYLFYGGSFGMTVDLGATFRLDDQFSFSASVLDLGYVEFDRNLKNYYANNQSFTYEGVDILQFKDMNDTEINERLQYIGDSLVAKFNIDSAVQHYYVPMTGKIYLGATYKLSEIENVNVLLRSEIVNGKWRPAFTASYYRQLLDDLGVIGSYTVANRSFANFGVGAYYNYAPVQIYFVTDNLPGIFFPDAFKYSTIHFGVNIFLEAGKTGQTLIDF